MELIKAGQQVDFATQAGINTREKSMQMELMGCGAHGKNAGESGRANPKSFEEVHDK